jgi:hypothetical protein
MDLGDLRPLLRRQSGLVSRAQVRAAGGTDNDLRRMVRRRELWRVHPGVFADQSGSLSWQQRAWAAVLGLGTTVELDGRLGHEWAADRWADLDRDLANALDGELTLRAGWRQVLDPCRLAAVVGGILIARGWIGTIEPCGPECSVRVGGSQAAGDCDPPIGGPAAASDGP